MMFSFEKVYKVLEKKARNFYAVKIFKVYLTQCKEDDAKNLERKIKTISKLKLIIFTKYISNGSLEVILELEIENAAGIQNEIIICRIAFGMRYLHFENIICCILSANYIFVDYHLHPKI